MNYLLKVFIFFGVLLIITACSGLSVPSITSDNKVAISPTATTSSAHRAMPAVEDSRAVKLALEKALSAIKQNDDAAADSAFKSMLDLGAKSPGALNHYAIYLRRQWRMDEAETIYRQALAFSPNNAMTHWNIAVFYELYRGDYKQAVVHYKAYQQNAELPDKRVVHWIADLTRRVSQEN